MERCRLVQNYRPSKKNKKVGNGGIEACVNHQMDLCAQGTDTSSSLSAIHEPIKVQKLFSPSWISLLKGSLKKNPKSMIQLALEFEVHLGYLCKSFVLWKETCRFGWSHSEANTTSKKRRPRPWTAISVYWPTSLYQSTATRTSKAGLPSLQLSCLLIGLLPDPNYRRHANRPICGSRTVIHRSTVAFTILQYIHCHLYPLHIYKWHGCVLLP